MKILHVRLIPYRGVTNTSIGSASTPMTVREGLILELQTESGLVGRGEASPLPGYSREARSVCVEQLQHADFRIHLAELASNPKDAIPTFLTAQNIVTSAARFAAELALLDLIGQASQRSIAQILCDSEQRLPRSTIPLAATMRATSLQTAMDDAARMRASGISTVKIKVGAPGQWNHESAIISALQEQFDCGVTLRIDANQAWTQDETASHSAELATLPFGQIYLEEPQQGGLLGMKGTCAVPIIADETLQQGDAIEILETLAQQHIISTLALKPMALGGIFATLAIAQRAAELDVPIYLSHLWDGPVALRGYREIAAAVPGTLLPCALGKHGGLAAAGGLS